MDGSRTGIIRAFRRVWLFRLALNAESPHCSDLDLTLEQGSEKISVETAHQRRRWPFEERTDAKR